MRTIAVFDFDGTITRKDTLLEFIKFCVGKRAFITGFALHLPFLIAYKLKLYPNWKVKQMIFSYFYKNTSYDTFIELGKQFKTEINKMLNPNVWQEVKKHQNNGNDVYIVSASIYEWIQPWATENGITHVISTTIETDDKKLITGRFLSKNCYGKEKVNRFLSEEPNRNNYVLYAYGDSHGDKDMFDIADKRFWCKNDKLKSI